MGRKRGVPNRAVKTQPVKDYQVGGARFYAEPVKDYQVGGARFYAEPVRDTTGDEFKAIVAELGCDGYKDFIVNFVRLYQRSPLLMQKFFMEE